MATEILSETSRRNRRALRAFSIILIFVNFHPELVPTDIWGLGKKNIPRELLKVMIAVGTMYFLMIHWWRSHLDYQSNLPSLFPSKKEGSSSRRQPRGFFIASLESFPLWTN